MESNLAKMIHGAIVTRGEADAFVQSIKAAENIETARDILNSFFAWAIAIARSTELADRQTD